ncbi:MAG: FAD-binding oxidoreductase [Steroidobacteraceae bacterium]|jgi:D-lactate dehydrogenase (cytochrome)|nr:FAD-binding oxidoreductase [Steroidobacteraceae bacterium]
MTDLISGLAAIVGADHVVADPDERRYFSRDLFPWPDAPVALAVVAPGTVEGVQALVRAASRLDVHLVTRGGGMSTGRSYVPATARSVILDLRRLNRVRKVDAGDRYVVVEAGCTWEALYAALPKEWVLETHAPLSGNYSTVGGALAHGYPGGLKGVLGVEVVRGSGEVLHTGSWGRAGDARAYYREYGPDLTGLFVGDTGAFGIKTAVSLHLVARPGARATASFGYERFEDVAATFVELAPHDVFTRRFCFDPYDTANLARVRAGEAASAAAKILGSAGSVRQGVKEGLSLLKAGLGGGAEACWSINLVAEQFTQEAADAAIAAGAKLCLKRGRQIPNVTALAGATPIYSVRRFLGRDGERWIATNAIFPVSRAVEVTRATESFFAARAAQLERHRVRIGYISQVTPVHWQIEPLFYWWDELEELHLRHLSADEAARFRGLKAAPGTREFVLQLRAELRDHFERLGALHVHLSKFFRYAEVLEPGARGLLQDLKAVLDPEGRINPGNLGLAMPGAGQG